MTDLDEGARAGLPTRIAAVIAVAAVVAFIVLFFAYNAGSDAPQGELNPAANLNFTLLVLMADRLCFLAAAALVLTAAASGGLFVLKLLKLSWLGPIERLVFSCGIGLGAISLLTLGAGLANLANRAAAVAILVALFAPGVSLLVQAVRDLAVGWKRSFSWIERFFAAVVAVAVVLTLLYAFNPPISFDALEYHLAAPAIHYARGAIRHIEYNVYSNFPANSEMLYLFSMQLAGGKMAGAILGKVLHAYVGILSAMSVYCLGRWLFSRGAGIFAAAALVSAGGFFQVTTGVYVEGLQTFYTLLAVLAVGRFLANGGMGWLVTGALCSGLAIGVKYPSALFVAAPLTLAVVLGRAGSPARRLRNAALFALVTLAAASPWLIKNFAFTGNPLYPLLYDVFGGGDWSALQDARWAMAHTPKGGIAAEQWARHALGLFFDEAGARVSLLTVLFIPFVLIARARTRRAGFVAGFAAFYFLGWFVLTHRMERFMVPAFAVLGALSGAGLFSLAAGRARQVFRAVAVVLALLNLFFIAGFYGGQIDPRVPLFGEYDEFLSEAHGAYASWQAVNAAVGEGRKVLLYGEAETFYLDVDFSASTVFDRNVLEEMALAAEDLPSVGAALRERGFTHIFVNWATFRRQQESYRFEFDGRTHEGSSELVTYTFFKQLEKEGIINVVYSSGSPVYPETPAYVLYRIR